MLFTVFATDYTKAIYLSLKVNHQLLGGGFMFPWSLNLFGFYPLFPINKTPCSQKCFQLMFPWSRKFLRCSLDPQKCLLLFTIFFCLLYPSIHSRKNHFRTASFFSLESAHAVLHRLPFLSSQLTQLPLRQWRLHWYGEAHQGEG